MTEPNFASGTVWTGDNLHIMRGMNSGCVDLIYLDPPFNSNRTYEAPIGSKAAGASFKDAWTLDDVDVHEHGELADRNPAAYAVIEAARQAHGKGMMSYLIFMAVRLMEMRRLLKGTGSIYLHCDPTASHYLKLLMDGIFGRGNFQNEIVWKRYNRPKGSQHKSRRFGRSSDVLIFYAMGGEHTFQPIHVSLSKDEIAKRFSSMDENGRYMSGPLLRSASMGDRPNLVYEFQGYTPGPWGWRMELRKLQEIYDRGDFYFTSRGVPRRKFRPHETEGVMIDNVWTDIDALNAHDQERLGYPTQKPLALLDRIIKASSNERDVVLDPFCGCATALVAADRLNRQWVGIDLSELAIKLVNDRIVQDRGPLWGNVNALTEPPKRTDMGDLPNYRTHRHRLYGEQEGVCVGCETHFPFRVMDVDHILPKSRGGTDHPDNLQLLCSGCNRSKGNRTMAEWRALQ